ncbi:hypothetical protein NQZ68_001585 [Dissostichus eleginoides]|nr:hypothetical protein NQZ68_001585 [Dissostichus eleginoides]
MDGKPPPLEPRLEKKERASPTSVLSENVNHPPREGKPTDSTAVVLLAGPGSDCCSQRAAGQSRGPCKPLDLLAKRGLCLVGGDVTDSGASEPASCSSLPRMSYCSVYTERIGEVIPEQQHLLFLPL